MSFTVILSTEKSEGAAAAGANRAGAKPGGDAAESMRVM